MKPPADIQLNRYIYNCKNAIYRRDMATAKEWYDKAFKLDPNDWRVMWMWDNFYKRPYYGCEDNGYEEAILARQDSWGIND